MKIKIDIIESDIIRSMKSNKYSPLQISAARHFKDDPANVEINYDSIIIWDDNLNDYYSYKYCVEDIQNIKNFLDEWNDYIDGNLVDFCSGVFSFCVEQKKIKPSP
jgi:hypothetical protein